MHSTKNKGQRVSAELFLRQPLRLRSTVLRSTRMPRQRMGLSFHLFHTGLSACPFSNAVCRVASHNFASGMHAYIRKHVVFKHKKPSRPLNCRTTVTRLTITCCSPVNSSPLSHHQAQSCTGNCESPSSNLAFDDPQTFAKLNHA